MTTERKRRQYGTGSIYQREVDGRWFGSILQGYNANGTRRRITVSCSAEQGEAEVKRRLKAKQKQIAAEGVPTAGVSAFTTVKSWADVWLEQTERHLRPKSWATDRSAVRRWIVPTIGQKRLDTLTPGDVRSVAIAIRKAGRSSSTALRAQVVLTKMLKDAIVEGHQVPPRVLMVDAPAAAVSDRDAIEITDALDLLRLALDLPDGSRWVAAFLQGMRQGECLGLTWPAVDTAKGVIDISWQLQALPYVSGRSGALRVPDGYEYRQLDGALCLTRPKTEKGQRLIPLVPWMAAALAQWRAIAPESPHGLIWPRPDGRPQTASADSAAWRDLQDAAQVAKLDGTVGRRYQLHEARHTTATLLLEANIDTEVIKAILGHSSIVTTKGYQHVSQALARKAMDGLAQVLQLPS
ncbi:MAG TPA: site-specific integrase [Mycobacterium sp.]|uniref:tyrosine-type recombinase/integrase n=1 Tax=Mycobacterium sp. TaxID=1785 RepID=UPI002F427AE9